MPGPGGLAAGKRGGLSGFFLWSMVRRVGRAFMDSPPSGSKRRSPRPQGTRSSAG